MVFKLRPITSTIASGIVRYSQVKAKYEGSYHDTCYSVQVIRKVGLPPDSIPAATSKRLREPQNCSNLLCKRQTKKKQKKKQTRKLWILLTPTHVRSLPRLSTLTTTHYRSLLHVLMHEYLPESEKSRGKQYNNPSAFHSTFPLKVILCHITK